jgi:hypothetical protein
LTTYQHHHHWHSSHFWATTFVRRFCQIFHPVFIFLDFSTYFYRVRSSASHPTPNLWTTLYHEVRKRDYATYRKLYPYFQCGNIKINNNSLVAFDIATAWKWLTQSKEVLEYIVTCLVYHATNNFSMSGCSDYLLPFSYTLVQLPYHNHY